MNSVIVFTRPFKSIKKFTEYYKCVENISVSYISDFAKCGNYGIIEKQHKYYISSVNKYKEIDYDEIISRDRYLVFQSKEKSSKLITAAWRAINEELENKKIKLFIAMPIDNYILHLLVLYCRINNINYLVPDYSTLNGYIRLWDVGYRVKVREPEASEVYDVINQLSAPSFKPIWLKKVRNSFNLFIILLKEKIRKPLFYLIKYISGQKYNFHYNCVYPLGTNYVNRGLNSLFVRSLFENDKNKIHDKIKEYSNIIYFPLQFAPESSLNYGIPSPDFAIYQETVENTLNCIDKNKLVIIKEHPDFYGYRSISFYKNLLNFENVLLVDVSIDSDYLIRSSNHIITTGSSSVSIQSYAIGKNVISIGGGFLDKMRGYNIIRNKTELNFEKINLILDDSEKDGGADIFNFIKTVLSCTIKGVYDYEFKFEKNTTNIINSMTEIVRIGLEGKYKPIEIR